ncbi:hypothetical protein DBR32_00910 [Taibaiella sp. KBW10]|uniref:hypothetical protein n=1 Tax=Taibaiella sp. KBW10 TaxID=2153357 RepID=UPI000F5A3AE3|nr:hypothetical protein [Taibaiella sp. KBW10]RQO32663.1 hypothetical protein DBR32_00910 [Taibaiella sp. KBW10]
MKYIFSLVCLFFTVNTFAQQANMEVSTLRIGPFKINMDKAEAESNAHKPLLTAKESNQYNGETVVKYNNELLKVTINLQYNGENKPEKETVTNLSTTSNKFRTKSGMGIGSTRSELLNTYKDFSNFEVFAAWEENGEGRSKTISYFVLKDLDASTALSFKLVNNVVVEISVYMDEGGC